MATWVTRVRACGTRGGRGRGRVATNMGCAHARRKCDTGRGPRVTVAPSVPTPPWPTTMQRRSTGVGAWVGASVGYVRQRVPTVSDGEEDGRRGVAQQREGQSVNVRRQAVRSSNGGAQAAGSQPCGCSQRLRDVRAKAIRDPGGGGGGAWEAENHACRCHTAPGKAHRHPRPTRGYTRGATARQR